MNIAFIGFRHSHIYGLYKEALNSPYVKITKSYEQNAQARKAAQDAVGVNFNTNSLEEIYSDKSIDIIAIGDYYGIRGKIAIDALKAGKHIIADKPICTSIAELQQIRRIAADKSLKVGCMLDLRYSKAAETVKKLIAEGEIGKITALSFTGQHCLNYGVRPAWYFEEGKHGGTINDIAIHGIDLINYVSGLRLGKILAARTWNAFAVKEKHFKDSAQFMVTMDNGAGLIADVSYSAPNFSKTLPTYWDFYFWGLEGMINYSYCNQSVSVYKNGKSEPVIIKSAPLETGHLNELIKSIKGEPSLNDTDTILNSSEDILKIQAFADEI